MRRALVVLSLLLVGLPAACWVARDPLGFAWLARRVRIDAPFDAIPAPPAPDYADPAAWSALPDRADTADGAPAGVEPDAQATAGADVFFVHPTTYYRTRSWNAPLDDAETNRFTDEVVIRGAASAFNACCRVYAPRYRQAALGAVPLFDETEDGARAIDLAYGDVEAAFDHYIAHWNGGRPFVLASHSQGSLHAHRLLERRIAGTQLSGRLVAAYLIGYGIRNEELEKGAPNVPVCAAPASLGCVVGWNTVGPGARELEDPSDYVCVNPLTMRTDGAHAPASANLGAFFPGARAPLPFDATPREKRIAAWAPPPPPPPAEPAIEPGAADAQCVDGRLVVRETHAPSYRPSPFWRDNYHVYDYTFFWANLRRDAVARVAAAEPR